MACLYEIYFHFLIEGVALNAVRLSLVLVYFALILVVELKWRCWSVKSDVA